MKIGRKLMLIISAVNLVCIGGLTFGSLMFTSRQVTAMAYDNAGNITKGAASDIKAWMEVSLSEIRALGQILSHIDYINNEDRRYMLNSMLHSLALENPNLIGVWAGYEPDALDGRDSKYVNAIGSDSTGRFLSYYSWADGNVKLGVMTDYDNPSKAGDYYRTSLASGNDAIIEPYYHEIGGRKALITSLTVPIRENGKIVGVAGVDVELTEIHEITSKIRPFGDGVCAVFSNKGVIVSHPDPSRLGKNIKDTEADMVGEYLGGMTDSIAKGNDFKAALYSAESGTNMILEVRPLRTGNSATPWAVAALVPEKTVLAPVHRMTMIFLVLGAIILGVITFIIYLISRSITSPLKAMEKIFLHIGEGDFTHDLCGEGNDEIGNISRSFNNTLKKIRQLIVTIKNQASSLSEIGSNLSDNMDETASAVTQITANIESIKNQVINQSASVSQTNASMELISINIEKLSGHIEEQSASVSQSSSSIEEMLANVNSVTQTLVRNAGNVEKLKDASSVGRGSLGEVVTDIQEITRESEGLLEINSLMENIAGQTNLLSMNAAIEAAHAGDAGKGFAVVADEIRKLAESSGEQSKTISTVLRKIKTSIDKINSSTQNILDRFETINESINTVAQQEKNIRGAMEEQGTGSKQILEAVARLNDITQQVKSSSGKMREGSKEVIKESKNLELVTGNITNGMSEMAVGASQINTAVIKVREISGTNKENIDTLVRAISRFKVE